MRKILVATTNPGKLAEISAMLDLDVEWVGLADFPDISEIKEDGKTFAENARKKAVGYAKQTGLWTLADDSGLVIDTLGGQPGVKSARFSLDDKPLTNVRGSDPAKVLVGLTSKNKTLIDHKNMQKVLRLLATVPFEKRTARFVCCLCLASAEGVLIEPEGKLEGVIAEREMGTNGFGYDPIFFVPKLSKTVAQLTREEKNTISHRGNAIRKLKPQLGKLLKKY